MHQVAELFQTLAWYNAQANAAMHTILADAPQSVAKEGSTYFGTLLNLLNHTALSDLSWLRRLAPANFILPVEVEIDPEQADEGIFETLERWWDYRRRLDDTIENFVASLDSDAFAETVEYRRKGISYAEKRWQCLLHMFNHQTHHRGQVAQLLDEHGVENDYSNIIRYVRARNR